MQTNRLCTGADKNQEALYTIKNVVVALYRNLMFCNSLLKVEMELQAKMDADNFMSSGLGDKFERSMTLGKLLDNNAQLFIFIS